jgi:hypothetical protein
MLANEPTCGGEPSSPVTAYTSLPSSALRSLGRIVATAGRALRRALRWISDGSEAGIIEPAEAWRIIAEHNQQRGLALASDIDALHEEMSR